MAPSKVFPNPDLHDTREEDAQGQDAIAVIGFAFDFPQGATNPDALWTMLEQARCASTEIPPERFNIDAFYHPDYRRPDAVSLLCEEHIIGLLAEDNSVSVQRWSLP